MSDDQAADSSSSRNVGYGTGILPTTSMGRSSRSRIIYYIFVQGIALFLPWRLRRLILTYVLGFVLDPASYVGYSLLLARSVEMADGSRIGHFNFIGNIDRISLATYSVIGNSNIIGGRNSSYPYFETDPGRLAYLELQTHAVLTHRHYIDCTAGVKVGKFAIVAGGATQIYTHQIDVLSCRQIARSVSIGEYSIVSTRATILTGGSIPRCSVIAAGAVVVNPLEEPYSLFAGVPARKIKDIPPTAAFFNRKGGHV